MKPISTKCITGPLVTGDLVLSTSFSEYSFLIGRVLSIDLLGTADHSTENTTDDVHVDFTAFEYSLDRTLEIEDLLSKLYGEEKTLEDAPLDDVIMPPNYLIRITGIEKERLDDMLEDSHYASCYIIEVLTGLLTETLPLSKEQADIKSHVLETIGYALPLAGYKTMSNDNDSLTIRRCGTDTSFEIKVSTIPG